MNIADARINEVIEIRAKDQILNDIGDMVDDLVEKITLNVEETKEKAAFAIKCTLSGKEGILHFEITGSTTLSTPKIIRKAQIIDKQLKLF